MRKSGFTAVELVVVIVLLVILVTVTMVEVDRRRQARLREESAADLKTLHTRAHVFWVGVDANGAIGKAEYSSWPPLSLTQGQLAPLASVMATPRSFIKFMTWVYTHDLELSKAPTKA